MSVSYLVHSTLLRVATPNRGRFLRMVKSREHWGLEQIRTYQEARLRETIQYCWQYVPFYRRHWHYLMDAPPVCGCKSHKTCQRKEQRRRLGNRSDVVYTEHARYGYSLCWCRAVNDSQ